ncbi:hypothetical protein C4N9_16650 [Pararhodobacter marinus]|uniref:Uncharacterized protein n=1 Tax=Pararhodobacter marinus TaxID=2184063 RepID=A0A2U2C738_9RHOB|nr:DUF6361 family protein [Pararhodobacter marinus]PWE27659.1 hypothetical protein C4N9_16650 [Pararhodobacter marinus]
MSSLAWIDFDEAERQRAQRITALFQERETRDELGLGAIRDSIADHLFPGTSTIQTRLRYMLFIPWLYRDLEKRDLPEAQLRTQARDAEIRLADALKAGGESNGIIGRDAGPRLQRLPSSVYWAGLGAWGIRVFPGSLDSLFVALRRRGRSHVTSSGEEAMAGAQAPTVWNPALPQMPSGLLERAVFHLTAEEAQFLIDRLVASQPNSLLTMLAREGIDADCDQIWTHPHLAAFPAAARRLVQHGEIFSHLMHGAALLYNLALSELRQRDDWIDTYRERLEAWSDELDLGAVRAWSLDDFWNVVEHPAHAVRPAAKRFVTEWRELVLAGTEQVVTSPAGRQLVEERERRLKTSQSRYANHAVRDRWTGASGAERLSFRWAQAKSHLRDLANAK